MSSSCQKITVRTIPHTHLSSDIVNFTNDVSSIAVGILSSYVASSTAETDPIFTTWANTYSANYESVYNSYNTQSADLITYGTGDNRYVNLSGDVMTGGLSAPTLSTDILNAGNIFLNDAITFNNNTILSQGTFNNGYGGASGISLFCAINYELNWQAGHLSNYYNGYVPITLDSDLKFNNTKILDSNGLLTIDPTNRVLSASNGIAMFSWEPNTVNPNNAYFWIDSDNRLNGDGGGLFNLNVMPPAETDPIFSAWAQEVSGNYDSTYNTVNINSGYWPITSLGTAAYTSSSSYFPIGGSLSSINDVIITDIATNDVLLWNGTEWVNYTISSPPPAITEHNLLTYIQGGSADEYYHQTLTEYNNSKSVYNTVTENSAINWNYQGTDVKVLTSNWQNTYIGFSSQSANNLSVYNAFNSNSSNYNSVYNNVNSNSGNWNYSYYTILTGGTIGGNVTVNGQVSAATMATNYVDFTSLTVAPTHINGRLYYDQTEQTLVFMDGDPTLTYPINKLLWTTGVNKTESVIPKGSVVYLSGAQGNRGKMWPALATSDYGSADTIGVTMQPTGINQEGYIMTVGELQGIDTRNFAEGSTLYLSTTAAGGITSIKPQAPNHIVKVGFSLNSTVNGKIYVEIDNGYELDELHNVMINGATNDQGLVYNSTSALWVNSNLYDGTDVKDLTANWQNTYTNLSAINNVVITDVLLYDVLSWGGSEWVNRTLIYPAPVTVHNDLNYIQGGNTNEYYHLSLSDYNNTLSVYSTVQANSATWTGGGGGGSDVSGLSANWQNTYTSFSTQSANNISVYSTVQSNSSYWPTTTLGSAAYTLSSSYFPINGNLEDINDVAVTSLSADQVLVWNGTTWVNRSFAVTAGARGAIYYPASGLSVISPYYDLLPYPIINGPIIQSATTSSGLGEVLINGYITNELNVNVIPDGLWTLNTYAYVNNVGGVSELIVRAYIRSADTTEREIFYNSSGELTTSAVLRISNTALSAIPTNLTDRLVVKFFAKTSTVSSKIVSYIQNTPNSYTTIQTPLEVVHNNLVGLQGGGSNEYYHQTLAQYNNASSVYTTVQSNSAQWAVDSTIDTGVRALTSSWQNTYTGFSTQSANNASVYTGFSTQSANNASVYTTVNTNSSINWNYQGTDIKSISSNWQNTYTGFSTQSANNASVYTTVNTNSAVTWLNNSYDEIWIGAGAMLSPTLSGATAATMPITATSNEIYIDSFTFDAAAIKYTQFDVSLPSNCNKQSIKVKFSWTTTTSAAAGDVVWGIQARILSDTNTIDGGWGTAQECTDTISGNTTFQVSSATAVLGLSGTSSADALLLFRVYRNASAAADTLAVNASLYGVKLQYSLAGSLSSSW